MTQETLQPSQRAIAAAADFMNECEPYLGDCGMKNSVHLALRQKLSAFERSILSDTLATVPLAEGDGWHDASETPPQAVPLVLEYRPWGYDKNEPAYQLGWYLNGEFRKYGGADSIAFCERWTTDLAQLARTTGEQG